MTTFRIELFWVTKGYQTHGEADDAMDKVVKKNLSQLAAVSFISGVIVGLIIGVIL